MLSSIKINRFRGIRECKIEKLNTINIFIGRNNQGKSSILEALYLTSAAFDFNHPFGGPPREESRFDKIRYLLNRRSLRGLSWSRGKDTPGAQRIRKRWLAENPTSAISGQTWACFWLISIRFQKKEHTVPIFTRYDPALLVKWALRSSSPPVFQEKAEPL